MITKLKDLRRGLEFLEDNATDSYDINYIGAMLKDVEALINQTDSAEPVGYPDCDTCGSPMDYMPWHYATETERHLHACNQCWPKVNPATNTNRSPVAFVVYMGGGVIELHHAPLPEFNQKPCLVVPLFTGGDTWLDELNIFLPADRSLQPKKAIAARRAPAMSDFKRIVNGAALAFGIGFWFAAGATLGAVMVTGFIGFDADYIMIVDQAKECEGGPCG